MSFRQLFAMAVVISANCGLAACGGGGARSETAIQNTTVSKGQALIDLKQALDSGAISPADYEAQKQKILKE
ncbi:SHOCT domain-containing protein [Azospirillum sp. sgz301742]